MTTLAARIRAMGYWQTIVRPKEVRSNRIEVSSSVVELVRGASVQLRGWDFPHVDYNERPLIEIDSVGQDIEWKYFHELWRVFASGQFVHLGGMRHDWGAPPQLSITERDTGGAPILGIGDALFRFTEIAMFASAYMRSVVNGTPVDVAVEIGGLKNRRLVVDDPRRFGWVEEHIATTVRPYPAQFSIDEGTDRDTLARLSRKSAQGLYRLFGADLGDAVLEDWQQQLRNW